MGDRRVHEAIGKTRLTESNTLPDETAFLGNSRTDGGRNSVLVDVGFFENGLCTQFFNAVRD